MSEAKLTRTVVVANAQGLHMRPTNLIWGSPVNSKSKIELVKGNQRVDGKSVLDIVTLGAEQKHEPGDRGLRAGCGSHRQSGWSKCFSANLPKWRTENT